MVRDGSAHERKRVPRVALGNEVKTHLNRIRVLVSKCYVYFWCRTQVVRDGSAHERKRVPRVALSNEVKTHLRRIRVLVSKCNDYFWCRTQVVRDGSAKPLCVGSNPIGTLFFPQFHYLQTLVTKDSVNQKNVRSGLLAKRH